MPSTVSCFYVKGTVVAFLRHDHPHGCARVAANQLTEKNVKRKSLVWPLIALVALAAACASPAAHISQTSASACSNVPVPVLLYPANGSTNVPPINLQLGIGLFEADVSAFSPPVLSAQGTGTVSAGPYIAPSPGPTNPPGLDHLPPQYNYFISVVPPLSSQTQYVVSVVDASCGASIDIGAFKTI